MARHRTAALLILKHGEIVLERQVVGSGPGRRVLPPRWRGLAGQPDSASTGFGRLIPGSPMGYGYQWWALPHGPTSVHAGAYWRSAPSQVVAAIQSAWRSMMTRCRRRDLRAAPSYSARPPTGPDEGPAVPPFAVVVFA